MASSESFNIQGLFIVIGVFSIFFLQFLPNRFISLYRRHRQQNSTIIQGHRHFIIGAQTLARARSQSPPSQTLIKSSISSADLAIALEPCDAAPHIFKALALNLKGHKIPALKSLDVALSSTQLKTLGPKEKVDALIKRAGLSLGVGKRRRRVDQAIGDLTEAMKIGKRSEKGLGLLGECYEWKGMIQEARRAYEEAIEVDGSMNLVIERLNGLREGAKVGY